MMTQGGENPCRFDKNVWNIFERALARPRSGEGMDSPSTNVWNIFERALARPRSGKIQGRIL